VKGKPQTEPQPNEPIQPVSSTKPMNIMPNKRKRKKHKTDLKNLFYCPDWTLRQATGARYDKILLDAQCTLDASVRHILQFSKVGWKEFDPDVDAQTAALQQTMILNAFQMLKPEGTLVYSTCSFSRNQNENVISWLLSKEPSAQLVPIPSLAVAPSVEGTLKHTLRFYPKDTQTSGMFIAKIRRTKSV